MVDCRPNCLTKRSDQMRSRRAMRLGLNVVGKLLAAVNNARTLPLVPVTPPRPIPLHSLRKAYVAAGNMWLRFLDLSDRLR